MRRWFATVRVRTTVFATLVVTGAGRRWCSSSCSSAHARGGRRAGASAADVAGLAKRQGAPADLTAAKEEGAFTQVVDEHGKVMRRARTSASSASPRRAPAVEPHGRDPGRLPPLDGRFRVVIRPPTAHGRVTVSR